ncbi:MAG: transcriptional repressor LexA [Clostridiales bacterium]|nr:transcriptional repressor LexA [Clostridiales bacterium]
MSTYRFTKSNLNETLEIIYSYIVSYVKREGYPPSVREICQGVGIRSTSTVHAHLRRLMDEGKIEYVPGKRRAIMVKETRKPGSQASANKIPLVGTVTAGVPILAEENIDHYMPFPAEYFNSAEYFVLKVRGDSMINAHIMDGDFVIVKRDNMANMNQIVVAMIGNEATVKRLTYRKGHAILLPENPAYEPIPFEDDDCRILGVVDGVFRSKVN